MEFGPIWRSMWRNKSGYLLIAVQIAVTMAIMVNAIAIMQERRDLMARPSGVDEANTFVFASVIFASGADKKSLIREDLDTLRNLPGVRSAIATISYPLRGGGWSMGLQLEPGAEHDGVGTAIYFVDEHGVDAYATDLVDGRNFAPTDVDWYDPESNTWPPAAIITSALAESLFPDEKESVVGKTVYINDDNPVRIVGVIDRLQAPWKGWDEIEHSMLVPSLRDYEGLYYVVRTEPGMREQLMPEVEELLAGRSKDRLLKDFETFDEVRSASYTGDAAMIKILTFTVSLLTAITALGIVGLASFNVSRRRRQIGIRRALGATRPAILGYFMLENFIVTGLGVVTGGVLAVALNMYMVQTFSLTPMAWYVVPAAMLILWLVGQAAVAGPARRASLIPPAIATRAT